MAKKTSTRKRKSAKTIVESTRTGKGKPGSQRLTKAWSVTSCQRLVALAEAWNEQQQRRAAARTRKKAIEAKLDKPEWTLAQKKTKALELHNLVRDIADAKNTIDGCVLDTMRLLFELGDNGTIFEHSSAEDQEPDEDQDDGQGQLAEVAGKGEEAPA